MSVNVSQMKTDACIAIVSGGSWRNLLINAYMPFMWCLLISKCSESKININKH